MAAATWLVICALSVLGLLAAEYRKSRPGIWVAKSLASTAFVGAALSWGALDSSYGRLILSALALCWLGDLLLIPRGNGACFRAGIFSFLLGHLAYAAAFVTQGQNRTAVLIAVVLLAGFAVAILRWLMPRVPAAFRLAIRLYVAVIVGMVVTAMGAAAAGASSAIAAGAVLFLVSDLAVARDRFVVSEFRNRVWGLPLYFGAQLLLASSVI